MMSRTLAMFIKEFVQLRRDRVTFATMIFIPVVQLLLFGYAINTSPRHLPTAVLVHEDSDLGRSILAALSNTSYFKVTKLARSEAEMDQLIRSGDVLFGVEIPAGFERSVRRGDRPALLVVADASDPVAAGTALGALEGIVRHGAGARPRPARGHRSSPPRSRSASTAATTRPAVTSLNIVPGLLGTILTMTMLIFTALSVTREVERGTMESLLAMPIEPVEIMLGKIAPYVVIGFIQAALIIALGIVLFEVPVAGSMLLLAALSTLFIATNLSIGYTFSTVAQNQLQAIQMSFMFFLPNILLSGFMFPFAGMPLLGAMDRRDAAPDALHSHRARHHAERRQSLRPARRGAGAPGPHAACDDAGGSPVSPDAGLSGARVSAARAVPGPPAHACTMKSSTLSAGIGGPSRKPWPYLQPQPRTLFSCSNSSMPSATVVMPRLVAERDHGLGDGARFLAALDVGDEGLVDLDLVEWERTQTGKRAVACAETVHARCARRAGAADAGWRACSGRPAAGIRRSRAPDDAATSPTGPVPAARFRSDCASEIAGTITLMATLIGAGQRAAWAQACCRVQKPISAIRPHVLGDGEKLVGRDRTAFGMMPPQ